MDLIEYLREYVGQIQKKFNAGSHNGRPMGQGDINRLLSSISTDDLQGVHDALLANLSSKRPIDQLILLKQKIDGHTVATSPLCLALADRDINSPIVRYLLLILIFMKKLSKIRNYYEWRGNKDECPNMVDYLGYDLLRSSEFVKIYNESIQVIQMVDPRWQSGGRRTRHRKHRSRQTRRRG
jgi:hypothetical protein